MGKTHFTKERGEGYPSLVLSHVISATIFESERGWAGCREIERERIQINLEKNSYLSYHIIDSFPRI